jgi:hypothetical protein
MTRPRQHGNPLVVGGTEEGATVSRLERISLQAGDMTDQYSERWLQDLIHEHPTLLPINEIEPAFLPAIPVCLELHTPNGYIDNFFITPAGNLLFAECKLWRNPEARRQVVAQVMDYVEGLSSWTYADLENAVAKAKLPGGEKPTTRLYELFGDHPELDEPEFIDAVSRNLRLGRGLFFIVGDGIREQTETLAAHLQAHAGIHFALALVELALFRLPEDGGLLVQPRVITRTVNVERGIVRIDDGRVSLAPVPDARPAVGQRKTLSEEEFYEKITKRDPELPSRLRSFLDRLEPLGVTPDFQKTLILRWRAPDGTALNVGYIHTNGEVWTDAVNWNARELGILDITQDYVQELADATHGAIRHSSRDQDVTYLILEDHMPRIEKVLDYEDVWLNAIERLGQRVRERLSSHEP